MISRQAKFFLYALTIMGFSNVYANYMICDGNVTSVLSGAPYCNSGERLGFSWSGGGNWVCSSNKNMDALIIAAYTTGKPISVRDNTWTSCNPPSGSAPEHIWFQQ